MHGMYYGYSLGAIRKKEQNHLKNKLNCQSTISPELIVSSIDNSRPIRTKQDKINYIEDKLNPNLENYMQNYTKFDELLGLKDD